MVRVGDDYSQHHNPCLLRKNACWDNASKRDVEMFEIRKEHVQLLGIRHTYLQKISKHWREYFCNGFELRLHCSFTGARDSVKDL